MQSAEEIITVLMAVRNGAAHLEAQLQSLAAQQDVAWRLVASDDGSDDLSRALIEGFAARHPVTLLEGPRAGFVTNFLSLILRHEGAGPVALADQDDVWLPEKLARAQAALATVPEGRPALYCAARLIWDPARGRTRAGRAYPHPPAFANALVENIAPGNTIVLNAAAARLARDCAPEAGGVFAHDWWLYQLVTGAGGQVIRDSRPALKYRQHSGAAIGAGETRVLANKTAALRGLYADRITAQLGALQAVRDRLTEEARATLDAFAGARAAPLPARLWQMRRAGVWRQGGLSHLSFWGAVILGRV